MVSLRVWGLVWWWQCFKLRYVRELRFEDQNLLQAWRASVRCKYWTDFILFEMEWNDHIPLYTGFIFSSRPFNLCSLQLRCQTQTSCYKTLHFLSCFHTTTSFCIPNVQATHSCKSIRNKPRSKLHAQLYRNACIAWSWNAPNIILLAIL